MTYIKKRPDNYAPPTFDELLKEYEELTKAYTRQHGRKAAPIENTPEGYRRLYKNVKSIKSRNKRKKIDADREQSVRSHCRYSDGVFRGICNGLHVYSRTCACL